MLVCVVGDSPSIVVCVYMCVYIGGGLMVLELSSCYSNWRPLASGLPQESSWMWTVPESLEQGVYLLRLREMGGRRLSSPQYPVTVRDKFEFVCPSPLDSDLAWEVRGTQTIQWRSFGAVDKAEVCVCVCACVCRAPVSWCVQGCADLCSNQRGVLLRAESGCT
jgi:hypothetical protein